MEEEDVQDDSSDEVRPTRREHWDSGPSKLYGGLYYPFSSERTQKFGQDHKQLRSQRLSADSPEDEKKDRVYYALGLKLDWLTI